MPGDQCPRSKWAGNLRRRLQGELRQSSLPGRICKKSFCNTRLITLSYPLSGDGCTPSILLLLPSASPSPRAPDVDPNDVLRRMYHHPDVSARPPAPKGQWTLEGGSPSSPDLFRVIAGRAASRLLNPSDAEPWRLWLDGMRAEGYAPEMPARSKSGQILGRYSLGFEDRHIEHVFNASADFCFVRSRVEAATPNPVALGTPAAGEPARLAAIPSLESAEGAMADLPRLAPDASAGRPKLPTEALQNIIERRPRREC